MRPTALLLFVVLLLAASCSPARKLERRCLRAQGKLNEAVRICPAIAQLQHDTIRIVLPGDSAQGIGHFTTEQADSLYAACVQYREALDAERQLSDMASDFAAHVFIHQDKSIDSLRRVAASRDRALADLRKRACAFAPVHDSTDLHDLRIWFGPAGINYRIIDHPRKVDVPHTSQTITAGEVDVESRDPWLWVATIFGWLAAFCLALLFISERARRLRQNNTR